MSHRKWPREARRGGLVLGVLAAIGLALLMRMAVEVLAEVLARWVYGGGAPGGVRFVEGRYGLVPVREPRSSLSADPDSERVAA